MAPMRRVPLLHAPQVATSPVVLWSAGVRFVKNSVEEEQEQALDLIAFSFYVSGSSVQKCRTMLYFLISLGSFM